MSSNGSLWPPPAGTAPSFPTAPPTFPPDPPVRLPRPPVAPVAPAPRRPVWPLVAAGTTALVVVALLAIGLAMLSSTRAEVRDVRDQLIVSRDDLRRTRTDLKKVQSQLDEAQASTDYLQSVVTDLQSQIDALKEQIDELQRTAAAVQAVSFGPTLGDRLGNPAELGSDDLLGNVIARTDARCLLGEAGDAALTAPRSTPELTGASPTDVAEIVARVEAIRRHHVDVDPAVQILSADEFDAIVRAEVAPLPDALVAYEEHMLELLGAIPPGFDLAGAYGDAPSGIAGFYDPSDGTVRVRQHDGREGLGSLWEVVLAHEVDHAVDDAALGLPGEHVFDADSALAAQAVGEGDATLAMQQYASAYVGLPAELVALSAPDLQPPVDDLPPYLRAEALFPYVDGARYLCYRYLQGGWSRVDQEFETAPTSSYQVLFPERPSPTAKEPSGVGPIPAGWTADGAEAFGAANVLWLLQAPGADPAKALPSARDAVADWAGGTVSVFHRQRSDAVVVRLSTTGDALCDALVDWYGAMRPDAARSGAGTTVDFSEPDQVARVRCVDGEVHVAIGPDTAVVAALAD